MASPPAPEPCAPSVDATAVRIHTNQADDRLYRRLVESVSDYAIYMLDPQGYVSSWNPGAQRFKGYVAHEILGRHFSQFYTPEDRLAGKPQRALSIAATEGRFEDRAWRIRKDGTRFRAHVVIDRIANDDGSLGGFAKITRDISDAYQKELELQRSEQRFRLLVSGVRDYAIYMLNLDGRISSWNAGAERFKGCRAEEVMGCHFSMFYTDEDRAANKPQRALSTAMNQGSYEDHGWRVRKDGRQFWAHVVIDLIRDEEGTPIGFAKITRDITERRAADLRLRELTSSHQELEQFIHIASHDLREPLRKVLAFSDLLLDEECDRISELGRAYVNSIVSATRRMQGLLASLLDLTRVTSQGQTFSPCSLNTVLNDVRADLEVSIRERGVSLVFDDLPSLEADSAQMRQLFQNLIENSIKYSRKDVPLCIEVCRLDEPDTGFVRVEVKDNGIGFEQQYAERIFGVFQRLHTRDQYPGAGIGLSICRKICARHGGTIEAAGEPDQGARFTIRLRRTHRPATK